MVVVDSLKKENDELTDTNEKLVAELLAVRAREEPETELQKARDRDRIS